MRNLIQFLIILFSSFVTSAQTYNVDPTFNQGGSGASDVNCIAVQPDGKIIIGGSFTKYNNLTNYAKLVRLNPDGSPDDSFSIGTGPTTSDGSFVNIFAVEIDSDGRILVGGTFTSFNGTLKRYIVRLNSNGSVDTSFNPNSSILPGTLAVPSVRTITIDSDGRLLVGGQFKLNITGPSQRFSFLRLNTDGALDNSFTNMLTVFSSSTTILASDVQSDGKILVGGFGVSGVSGIERLNPDGSVDTNFNSDNIVGTAFSLCPVGDSKMLMGGAYRFGSDQYRIFARLNPDCSEDQDFTSFLVGSGSSAVNVINCIKIIDNKIWIGGHFTTYGSFTSPELVRLNMDGTIDNTFFTGTGPNGIIRDISLGVDQKVLIAGQFQSFNGASKPGIARLTDQELGVINSTSFPSSLMVREVNGELEFVAGQIIKSISIFDLLGKQIKSADFDSNLCSISGIPGGVYIARVVLNDGSIVKTKLIQ